MPSSQSNIRSRRIREHDGKPHRAHFNSTSIPTPLPNRRQMQVSVQLQLPISARIQLPQPLSRMLISFAECCPIFSADNQSITITLVYVRLLLFVWKNEGISFFEYFGILNFGSILSICQHPACAGREGRYFIPHPSSDPATEYSVS
jgi:hypothetical protein